MTQGFEWLTQGHRHTELHTGHPPQPKVRPTPRLQHLPAPDAKALGAEPEDAKPQGLGSVWRKV